MYLNIHIYMNVLYTLLIIMITDLNAEVLELIQTTSFLPKCWLLKRADFAPPDWTAVLPLTRLRSYDLIWTIAVKYPIFRYRI